MSCDPEHIVFDAIRGEQICIESGEVISDHITINSPEWRAYNYDEWLKRSRAGAAHTYKVHDHGLSTDIDLSKRKYREYSKMVKLRYIHRKMRVSKKDKKLVEALATMNRVCAILRTPEVVKETAGMFLKKIFDSLTVKKNKINAYIAAAVIIALRKHGIPVRHTEVLRYLNVSADEYWRVRAEISLALGGKAVALIDPRRYIPQIATKLGLSADVQLLASKIIDILKKRGFTEGKDPVGIAAASIYIASILMNEKRTQKEVAEAAQVTEVTIRNRYRDMIDKLMIEVKL
ncbi:MAG: transcription initiation factor IIB [Thermoprotei archaeon]|nr:MAG: transcription initiation factor IIB [Thermoprotei archaeon]